MANTEIKKMQLYESIIRESIPNSIIKNGLVFQTVEPMRKHVLIGSVNQVVNKILRGDI